MFDPLFAAYRTGDDRFVRLHMNFPHHRENVLKLLGCAPTRASIEQALGTWEAVAFETEAYRCGGVAAAMRSPAEWAAHPQAAAIAARPVISFEKIGGAPPRPLTTGERPLSGLRVLDLTRIIAGPVAGRALGAHGADVMRISAPGLPFIDWLMKDTGRGKLSAYADLATPEGTAALRQLAENADIFLQSFRPGALEARGFGFADVAKLRPGIVYGSLSTYGDAGPWAARRGFDSLVQTATGFNHAESQAAGVEGPKELPCQALDHATGYLLAFGTLMARIRQAHEGGSWLVRVLVGGDRALAVASGPAGQWIVRSHSVACGCRRFAGRQRIALRRDARRAPCRGAFGNVASVDPAGSAAWHPPSGLAESMIRKSGNRFSEKIVLH